MVYPTRRRGSRAGRKRAAKGKVSTIGESRVSASPEIFVRLIGKHSWRHEYARAHLRNRKGYLYLSWRDGRQVREYYLGKAPRNCPTGNAGNLAPGAADRGVLLELRRRVKIMALASPAAMVKQVARRRPSRP